MCLMKMKMIAHVLPLCLFFSQDAEIGPSERDEAVRWLATLSTKVQAYPETFAMSVSILDRFLNAVKVNIYQFHLYLLVNKVACQVLAVMSLSTFPSWNVNSFSVFV